MPERTIHNSSLAGRALLVAVLLLLAAPRAQAADGGAIVSGVVRDAQGVAQLGALVQVLLGDKTIATAFTDQHGRYLIPNLSPGRYLVRASATLLVPASRPNLQLNLGSSAVVNLTLASLFDTASWLPTQRRRADEPEDDWKWTLRSTASRPILRIVEDGETIEVSSSATETIRPASTKARATVSSGDGSFGGGGLHNTVAIHRELGNGDDMMLRADIASTRVPAAQGASGELDAGFEHKTILGGAQRTVASYRVHPELTATGLTDGVAVLEVTSAQRIMLGEQVEVEVGGKLQAVHTSIYGYATRPFVRLAAHTPGSWTLQYRMATDRELQGFEDVTSAGGDIPVALVRNGKLALEQGRHQEASAAHKAGRATVQAVYFHDALGSTSLAGGGGASGPGETQPGQVAQGMLVDPTTGSFRALGAGYHTDGERLSVSAPLTPALWIAAEYSHGAALASTTGGTATLAQSVAGLHAQNSQAATIAVKGKLVGAGTRLRASYRWQPSSLVTAVDSYSGFADQPFLSCQIRQPIHLGSHAPQGLEATIDVTNLLAEGYRPFLSADGQTLYFAQAPRTIQAGLSFTF